MSINPIAYVARQVRVLALSAEPLYLARAVKGNVHRPVRQFDGDDRMLFDWRAIFDQPGVLAVTLAVIMIGKPLAALVIVLLLRYPLHVALKVSVVLAQVGEFSFILATMGRQLHILPDYAANVLIASAILSITLNPLTYRFLGSFEKTLRRVLPSFVAWTDQRAAKDAPSGATSRSWKQ